MQTGQAQCSAEGRAQAQPQGELSEGNAGSSPQQSSFGPLTLPYIQFLEQFSRITSVFFLLLLSKLQFM